MFFHQGPAINSCPKPRSFAHFHTLTGQWLVLFGGLTFSREYDFAKTCRSFLGDSGLLPRITAPMTNYYLKEKSKWTQNNRQLGFKFIFFLSDLTVSVVVDLVYTTRGVNI